MSTSGMMCYWRSTNRPDGFDGGPSEPFSTSFALYSDGAYFRIVLPPIEGHKTTTTYDINGFNDDGLLVGRRGWSECSKTPGGPLCIGESHGFIATPAPLPRAKK